MRKLILTFVLGTLCLCAFSQEAFYIYRNDGDFNGFFYDEVVEMRQSKIGVDSVEYDRWVTQEVVLADTIYRIPLAAIDSIGFQQPEIKLNPRVRFMERDGLCPYFMYVNENALIFDANMPASLRPKVGDVIIGLKTDSIAETMYDRFADLDYGSFSCVVEEVGMSAIDGEFYAIGHPVDKISDLFEQYITVEEIGIDDQNQIHRRVAGCTPDGIPYKMPTASGHAEKTILDINSTISQEFYPGGDDAKIDFSASVNMKYKMRVAYKITLFHLYMKISNELSLAVEPSIGISVSRSFENDPFYLIGLPEIVFPAACPILAIDPFPEVFVRGSGTLEARLKFPKVSVGAGTDIILDSKAVFPATMSLHLLHDDDKKASDDLFDLSGDITFSGFMQAGLKFSAAIETASWFKKVLKAQLGFFLYAGPKVSGEMVLSSGTPAEMAYSMLSNAKAQVSLLSLDLEGKATIDVAWQETMEKTFFTIGDEFMTTQVRLAPSFNELDVDAEDEDSIKITLETEQCYPLLANSLKFGIDKKEVYDDPNFASLEPAMTFGNWSMLKATEESYSISLANTLFKGYQRYVAYPIVDCGVFGTHKVKVSSGKFDVPVTGHLSNDAIHFTASGKNNPHITINTNIENKFEKEVVIFNPNKFNAAADFIDSVWTEAAGEGIFNMYFRGKPTDALFAPRAVDKYDSDAAYVQLKNGPKLPFSISQDNSPLRNFRMTVSDGNVDNLNINNANVSRIGQDSIVITGSGSKSETKYSYNGFDTDEYTVRYTASVNITIVNSANGPVASGSITSTEKRDEEPGITTTKITHIGSFSNITLRSDHEIYGHYSSVYYHFSGSNESGTITDDGNGKLVFSVGMSWDYVE